MAINIGTNFSYRGQNFLDQRQGLAKTTADLLSWSEIVPEGFEVYCSENGKWYTYRSDFSSIETGHFKLRIDSELEDSDIQKEVDSIGKTLDQIDSKVLPIEFRNVVISKGKNIYLIGKTVIPEISWELWKDDKKIKADKITVTINGEDDSVGVKSTLESYVGSSRLNDGLTNLVITAEYKDLSTTLSYKDGLFYNLIPKKYIAISSKNIIQDLNTDTYEYLEYWAGATNVVELGKDSFIGGNYYIDCTGHETEGGVYLHYIVPGDTVTEEDLVACIGGINTSSYTINDITLVDPNNSYPENYLFKDICFDYKQNGLLNLEFKQAAPLF